MGGLIMGTGSASRLYLHRDGGTVEAVQYDGRVAGFYVLLAAFPGQVRPHPSRDDVVLVGDRMTRVETGEWVARGQLGRIDTWPDDQFRALHRSAETVPA